MGKSMGAVRHRRVAIAAAAMVGLLLTGCEKPPTPERVAPPFTKIVAKAEAAAHDWVLTPVPPGAKSVSATRRIPLEGGGRIELSLSCDNRDTAEAVTRGFWLTMELVAKDDTGNFIALDKAAYDGATARLNVTRSTGEDGAISLEPGPNGSPVYSNNQTNELNLNNNDPAKVEMPKEIALPLADGRNVVVKTASDSADYAALMAACRPLPPFPAQ